MPLNLPGLLAPLQLLVHPRLVLPSLALRDIRHLDFAALRKQGYRAAVFDKDNCLTLPEKDTLVPELQSAWDECRKTFGKDNVLIVSNSAGTYRDAGGIQSESVSHHLQVPVLQHKSFKPAYSCISAIRTYFSSLPRPISDDELVIVGDRIFTDIVMANRMRLTNPKVQKNPLGRPRGLLGEALSCVFEKGGTPGTEREDVRKERERHFVEGRGPLAVWTTGVWEKEAMGMRYLEKKIVQAVERWSTPRAGEVQNGLKFVRRVKPKETPRPNPLVGLWSRLTRA